MILNAPDSLKATVNIWKWCCVWENDCLLTIGLNKEKQIWISFAPFAVDGVGVKQGLELNCFSFNVPNQEYFIIGSLGNDSWLGGAPRKRCYVLVSIGQQFNQLERFLVIDVDCQGRSKCKFVRRARQDLLLPHLDTWNCYFLRRQIIDLT